LRDQANASRLPLPAEINPRFSAHLDAFRCAAAGLVAIGHLRGTLFLRYDALPASNHGPLQSVLYLITSLGAECVMVFFVLSGMLVGGAAMRDGARGRLDLRRYAIARVSRLYPVLILAMILGGIIVQLPLYSPRDPVPDLRLSTTVGNLFFLQTIRVPIFGLNDPLWSLANEFWYYALFPVLLCAIDARSMLRRGLWVTAALAIAWFMGSSILSYFPLWLLGVVVRCVRLPRVRKIWLMAAWGGFLASLVWSRSHRGLVAAYGVGLTFAFLLALLRNSERAGLPRYARWASWFSAFSFSLYLTHYPVLGILRGLDGHLPWHVPLPNAGPGSWLHLIIVTAVLYVYAYIFSLGTERLTPKIRRALERLTGGRRATSGEPSILPEPVPPRGSA